MAVVKIASLDELNNKLAGSAKSVLFFWAQWHEPSKAGGQMQGIFSALSEKYAQLQFLLIEAEAVPEASETLGVAVVPTFFTYSGKNQLSKLEGANPSQLKDLVKKLSEEEIKAEQSEEEKKEELHKKLAKLIHTAPVMLFMKGTPEAPRCGFSRKIVEILKNNQISFASFDILTDEEVRQGLKEYSEWPTYPQLYVNGSLIGGLDIVKEMADSGDLKTQLGLELLVEVAAKPTLDDRLKALTNQAPVMLFMKGSPEQAKCGFSRQIVEILKKNDITFSSFDILSDEEVRQGLKVYSDWPTYPQLYVNGTLAGGLDIVKEMAEGGDLKSQLGL
jgi:Grx4 family monothiol glutaredoxin